MPLPLPLPLPHPALRHRALTLLLTLACASPMLACGGGGGGGGSGSTTVAATPVSAIGPADLAVLIAEGDATSEAIGRAYQLARGIPDANVVRLPVDTGHDAIPAADFAHLKATLDARLPAGVQATLLTWTRPSRVLGSCAMGITSALALGFDARWCGGCAATAASPYYASDSRRPFSELGIRPSMMLGAATLAEAQALIARGVAADGLFRNGATTGNVWMVRTSDGGRSTRADDFRILAAVSLPRLVMHYVDNAAGSGSDLVTDQSDVMVYLTGLSSVARIDSNRYLPGAVADSLTSFAGVLPDSNGQMPATDWLRAGATASYGTVEEPCNFPAKFPRASVLVSRYQRGESLIEAYWKSVQWPGQGLFVGEPLARPWAP